MACERYHDALTDVAAGLPAPAGLEAHLASCEVCREELQGLRQALAMADAAMAGLATAEPSPGLAARIRQAAAETRELSPHQAGRLQGGVPEWGLPPTWRFGWLWPATAAACMLLVALAVWTLRGHPSAPEPRVAVDAHRPQSAGRTRSRAPVGEPVAPVGRLVQGADGNDLVSPRTDRPAPVADGRDVVTPRSSGQAERRGVRSPGGSLGTRQGRVPRDDRAHQPEVIAAPGEAEALLRFVALVYRDRQAPTSLAAAGQPPGDLAEPAPLDIPPLEIVPLDAVEAPGT